MENSILINELKDRNRRQEEALNEIAIRCSALEYENTRLRKLLLDAQSPSIDRAIVMQYEKNPMSLEEAMQKLATPIEFGMFHLNIARCLKKLNMLTVRDLLIEIKYDNMKNIKSSRGVGDKAILDIFKYLQKKGIFDQYNRTYLYMYI